MARDVDAVSYLRTWYPPELRIAHMDPNPYESPKARPSACTNQTTLAHVMSFGIDRTWRVDNAQRCHEIRLRHSFWTGHATIEVDDDMIYHRTSKLIDFGLRHSFVLDGTTYTVRITPSWLPCRYELLVDELLEPVALNPNSQPSTLPNQVQRFFCGTIRSLRDDRGAR